MDSAPTPRAERFTLQIPLQYRVAGERLWQEGQTVNISVSGLLFCASELVAQHTPLELVLSPPVAIGKIPAGRLLCVGHVARSEATHPGATQAVAAKFDELRSVLTEDLLTIKK